MLEMTFQLVIKFARLKNHKPCFFVFGQSWVSKNNVRRRRLPSQDCDAIAALKRVLLKHFVVPNCDASLLGLLDSATQMRRQVKLTSRDAEAELLSAALLLHLTVLGWSQYLSLVSST
jgi:hypothetical protein